jgi:integrase/recombinase XerD
MRRFRPFQVRLPSGDRYWTVIDSAYRPVAEADEWLLHVRLGRDCAESTTEAYARSLGLFLEWCAATGLDWRQAPGQFGRFVYWVQRYDPDPPAYAQVRVVRGARRVTAVLAAVREFFRHAVAIGRADKTVLDALFDLVEDYDLPAEVRGDRAGLRLRGRPRHRLQEPERVVDAASDEEVLALLWACRNARDRFIVLALWRIGNRRGELTGVRLEDVHFVPDATRLGCRVRGEHLHVRRRDNPNGAVAKSRRSRAVPADWFVVQGYDQYTLERGACPQARRCDFLLVNLFREPLGAPMRPKALNELLAGLSRRAGLPRVIHPHQLRHSMATNVAAPGGTLDEIRELLGHAAITSSQVYMHPSPDRLRSAVDRVPSPRAAAVEARR